MRRLGMMGRRVAMWSGPRHLSTALMRSWENRPDTRVIDEPLYAHYLKSTGIQHPMREEVLRSMQSDWRRVVEELVAAEPEGSICYQKHMTHHLTPEVELDWVDALDNCFLIRDPEDVIRSYRAKRERVQATDLGYVQQRLLFEHVREQTRRTPPVIEVRDLLDNPRGVLEELCRRLAIPFHEGMLHWPEGPRDSDGVWAAHWYAAVERSTGFRPPATKRASLDDDARAIAESCRSFYEELAVHRIRPSDAGKPFRHDAPDT